MPFPDIQILSTRHLRGPNVWTYRAAVEVWVDIGALEDHPSNTLPGFNQRLQAWLPGMIEHRCSVGVRGGFFQRLLSGTWAAHIMEHVAIELQTMAGLEVGFGKARETHQRGIYKVVVRARQYDVALGSLLAARDLVMAAINDTPFDLTATVNRLKAVADRLCLGPSTASIVDAAAQRGIPSIRLTEGNLVQLGHGSRQRRIWTAETDRTSAVAESISRDKDLTKRLLAQCGVPIPEGRIVDSPEHAWAMAQDMGLPVVIKPSDGNHGRGVALDLNSQNEIEAAWRVADAEGSQVMVERFVRGEEHRLLVVGDQVVAAARGELACITGDGVTTVALLIEQQLNTDPRRGEEEHFPLDTIRLDEQPHAVLELQRQGLSADSIPALGRRVIVQRNGNMSNDVTDLVHPEVAELATLAARVIGLDIAGIDLVAQDISRPLHEQGAAVVEVNAGPSLLMHLKPASGQARPVGQAIANHLFPPKDNGRIPIVGIVGYRHTASLAQLVAWLLHLSGSRIGMACSLGVFMDQRHVDTQDARGFEMGERLLINRNIDAAVFETSPREILLEGLPYDRCHVGLVADMPAFEGLQDLDVTSADNMRQVVRTQVDVVLREGVAVLNADVSAVAELEDLCDGEVMMYGLNPDSAILGAHRRQGRRSVFCRQGHVTLARGDQETTLLHLDLAPVARLLKHEDMSVSHLLAAVACAWSLGVTPTLMRAGLKNFRQKTESESQEKARMKA